MLPCSLLRHLPHPQVSREASAEPEDIIPLLFGNQTWLSCKYLWLEGYRVYGVYIYNYIYMGVDIRTLPMAKAIFRKNVPSSIHFVFPPSLSFLLAKQDLTRPGCNKAFCYDKKLYNRTWGINRPRRLRTQGFNYTTWKNRFAYFRWGAHWRTHAQHAWSLWALPDVAAAATAAIGLSRRRSPPDASFSPPNLYPTTYFQKIVSHVQSAVQLVEIPTEWHSAEKQTAADQLHGHLRLPSVPCEAMKLAFSFWCLKGTCQNLVSWYLMKHATGIFSWSTPTSTPKHRVCACRDKIPPWRDRVMDQSMSWQYYSFGKTQTHVATKTHMRRSKPFLARVPALFQQRDKITQDGLRDTIHLTTGSHLRNKVKGKSARQNGRQHH